MMKKILLIVLFTSFTWVFGQNLSMANLLNFKNMELDEIEMFLTSKGWKYIGGKDLNDHKIGTIDFIYSKERNLVYGEAFLSIQFTLDRFVGVWMQIGDETKYLEYLNAVKKFKPTLVFSGIQRGNFVKIYQGATTKFTFSTGAATSRAGNKSPIWYLSTFVD